MPSIPQKTKQIAKDIRSMRIRGAGRIARAAVQGLMVATRKSKAASVKDLLQDVAKAAHLLYDTRPSAVSLPNSLRYFFTRFVTKVEETSDVAEVKQYTQKLGDNFITLSLNAVKTIGDWFASYQRWGHNIHLL